MKRSIVLVLSLLAILVSFSLPAQARVIPDQYIVVLKDAASPYTVAARYGLAPAQVYSAALNGFSARIPANKLAAVRADARVKLIEPDIEVHILDSATRVRTQAYVSQPAQVMPYGIYRIGADLCSVAKIDGKDERLNIDVAIIDTGVAKHPDLNWYTGYTAPGLGKKGGIDDEGHGTHVAGTIAALDNGIGVVGVAPGARIWAVKVLNSYGYGSTSGIIAGVDYVTRNARYIEAANMSLGGVGTSPSLRLAIKNSVNAGVFYAVAAGNESADVYGADGIYGTADDYFPASYPEVATVSALADSDGIPGGRGAETDYGTDDIIATFSNFSESVASGNPVVSTGAKIDLAAPGVNIYSTYLYNGYTTMSGTSMACPHLCGAAALYIAAHRKPTSAAGVYAVRQALINLGTTDALSDLDDNQERVLNVAGITAP
ncbi:MAG: S8 family serine peptidase [Armatimonadota bacterium]